MASIPRASARRKKAAPREDPEDALTHSALKLIDQASNLLKKGIREGGKHTVTARKAFKKKALSLVGVATDRLTEALDRGGATLRRGIRKL
ncbi:MAG: hypothetical protein IT578_07985 [Verrucomicrobiae bacterium]|nr:hypothetical protein [Verrucomicrobiae bacterium]